MQTCRQGCNDRNEPMKKSVLLMMSLGLGAALMPMGCASSAVDDESQTFNVENDALQSACYSNAGINPTKAALAVAMADELGRWDAVHDLTFKNDVVVLSSTAVCIKNGCRNTKAILGQQDGRIAGFVPQDLYNPVTFNRELVSSVRRQADLISDLARNNPRHLPPGHKLTKVAGPVSLGTGACGPHYVFQVDHTNGTALSAGEAANMANALCFYGDESCGLDNPFLGFTVTGQGCPRGRTCVAVDPTDGDNGSLTTTTGQNAVSYPFNRLYDPGLSKLGSPCITRANFAGAMLNKCSIVPSTCGYLYCVATQ